MLREMMGAVIAVVELNRNVYKWRSLRWTPSLSGEKRSVRADACVRSSGSS